MSKKWRVVAGGDDAGYEYQSVLEALVEADSPVEVPEMRSSTHEREEVR